jgi:hypothetical protein
MSEHDDNVSRLYRGLAREEPPAALDRSILAASRRAVSKPALARRWAAPVSIAAVLVLAFGVTLQMQREEPGIEYSAPSKPPSVPSAAPAASPPPPAEKPAAARSVAPEPQAFPRAKSAPAAPARKLRKEASPQLDRAPAPIEKQEALGESPAARSEARPFSEPEAPHPLLAPPASKFAPIVPSKPVATTGIRGLNREELRSAPQSAAPAARSGADAASANDRLQSDEERELERIAKLRLEGRADEADKALDEFRRKHPDYRIPEAMWQRMRPR